MQLFHGLAVVSCPWDSPMNALAEEVLNSAEDKGGVIYRINLNPCQGH